MDHAFRTSVFLFAAVCLLAGCADNSAIITGQVRPATTPDKVQVYLQPPARKYDTIGLVTASSKGKLAVSRQKKTDVAMRILKEKAAEIGANGVILQSQGMNSEGAVGTASGGVFVAGGITYVELSGTAIFVP